MSKKRSVELASQIHEGCRITVYAVPDDTLKDAWTLVYKCRFLSQEGRDTQDHARGLVQHKTGKDEDAMKMPKELVKNALAALDRLPAYKWQP